jgi:4-hydroxy-tetrahydrodipicolinate synthase
MNLSGVFPALVTPFDASGELALDKMRANISALNRTGLAGYLVNGSTAECVFMTRAEMEQVLAAVREAAAPGRILIAGTGAESTAETKARTQAAAKLGCDCVLVNTPCYYKPMLSADAYVEHYHRVADASPVPVLLYSVPQFTGVALEADLVARLAEHPNIIGMKDSSGNVDRVGAILDAVPEKFQLLVGSASTLFPSMLLGAVGGILALANFLPELSVELQAATAAKDLAKARSLQSRINPPSKKIVGALGIPGVKYAMDSRGYYGGPARRPLLPLTQPQKQSADSVLAAVLPAAAAR